MQDSSLSSQNAVSAIRRRFAPHLVVLVLCTVFVLSRAIYLDADAPHFEFASYAPTDEAYYTIPGFNLFHHGAWIFRPFDFLPPDTGPFTAAQSFLTFISLSAFGNTFFGLRAPAVVCGLLTFAAVLFVVAKQAGSNPTRNWIVASCAVFMLADYFFQLSARYSDPTTFMMAFIAAALAMTAASDNLLQRRPLIVAFLFGAVAGFGITFVYIYTVYVGAALAVTIGLLQIRDLRLFILSAISFTFGLALLFALFCLFTYLCFHQNPIDAIITVFEVGRTNTTRGAIFTHNIFHLLSQNLILGLKQTIIHNLFAYNPAFLLLFLVSLPVFLIAAAYYQKPIDVFVAACLVFRVGLSVLIPYDYYEKKLIQVFPLVVYVIACATIYAPPIYREVLKSLSLWKFSFLAYIALVIFVVTLAPDWRTPRVFYHAGIVSWWEMWAVAAILGIAIAVPASALMRSIAIVALTILAAISGIRLTIEYIYARPTFLYRDALVNAAPKLNGKILAGGVAYSMRLYNTSVPIMNFYMYYYYGQDRFTKLSTLLFDKKLADGTILFIPRHQAPILSGMYQYVESGGLVLDAVLDVKDVERKYKFGLYLRPDLVKPN